MPSLPKSLLLEFCTLFFQKLLHLFHFALGQDLLQLFFHIFLGCLSSGLGICVGCSWAERLMDNDNSMVIARTTVVFFVVKNLTGAASFFYVDCHIRKFIVKPNKPDL